MCIRSLKFVRGTRVLIHSLSLWCSGAYKTGLISWKMAVVSISSTFTGNNIIFSLLS